VLNIVLVHPRIPQNVGAIGRLCVNLDADLHVVGPTLVRFDEKSVRSAGLDYWKFVKFHYYAGVAEFLDAHGSRSAHFHYATTKTSRLYYDAGYALGDFLIFGSETFGLPSELMSLAPERHITIPMPGSRARSLNLAMSVGIVAYEAVRQNIGSLVVAS